MCHQTFTFQTGDGRMRIQLNILHTDGNGLAGFLFGGELPHVGGIALAYPQQAEESALTVCDSLRCPAHRDDVAAKLVAQKIAAAVGETTAISAGIHLDNITKAELNAVLQSCEQLADRFIEDYLQYVRKADKET